MNVSFACPVPFAEMGQKHNPATIPSAPPERPNSQPSQTLRPESQNAILNTQVKRLDLPMQPIQLRIRPSEQKNPLTRTDQAFFSSRRALLIQRVVIWSFSWCAELPNVRRLLWTNSDPAYIKPIVTTARWDCPTLTTDLR
jgi:hypothetical protein